MWLFALVVVISADTPPGVQAVLSDCTSHCILHHDKLAGEKNLLKSVLDEAVKRYSFNKSWNLKAHLFIILFNKMGSTHKVFLLHSKVWWLSYGKTFVWLSLKKKERKRKGRISFFIPPWNIFPPTYPPQLKRTAAKQPWLFQVG